MLIDFKKIKENYILFFILIGGLILRLYALDFQSPWDDEIASMIEADPSISFLESYKIYYEYDNMPPLYFITLKIWSYLFGFSVYSSRMFSCIGAVTAIYAIYMLAKTLFNKSTGLIAAAFLCINYFGIYFAQEIRPYSWLVCFACLSFYSMIQFIRFPSTKNSLKYGLFTALFLSAQFFALFAIASQCLLLLYVLFITPKQKQIQFIKKGTFAFVLLLLCLLASYPQLIKNANITNSWIPEINADFFSVTLSEFFYSSEFALAFVYTFLLLFFVKLTKFKNINPFDNETFFKSNQFSTIVIVVWLIVSILVPYLRSYLVLPILIPRYLNIILPCLIIMMAFGVNSISFKSMRIALVIAFVGVSLIHLIWVKKFYTTINKTDYRAIAEMVNKNYKTGQNIVANNGWHFALFFKTQKAKNNFYWATLKEFSQKLPSDSIQLEPFWYVCANDNSIESVIEETPILKTHYSKTTEFNAYRTKAILFTPHK